MQYIFILLALCFGSTTFSQSLNGNGFEVHTRLKHPKAKPFTVNKDSIVARIHAIPDTALQTATFVYTVADAADITALELVLTDSRNQTAYQVNNSVSALTASGQYKVIGQTIYITAGAFPYLKSFTAQLRTTNQDGVKSSWREFVKH